MPLTASPYDFGESPLSSLPPTKPVSPLAAKVSTFIQRVQTWYQELPQVATIAGMEINLTAIWDFLTAPIRWVWRLLFGGRARSRRRSVSTADSQLKRVKIFRWVAIGGFGAVVAGVLVFFMLFAWYSRDLPKPGEIVRHDGFSTVVTDRNGGVLYDLFQDQRRVPVTAEQIPQHLKNATVAIEDKDFYKHGGFDWLTILRIPYNVVVHRRLIGGSTLTQQLVKNVLLTNERTLGRKFKEFVLALQIERKFSKDEILVMYLNEAPFGGTAWGIGAASEGYFNKPVSQLNLVESAILAGLPQRPSAYSPFTGKTDTDGEPLWRVRARGVLISMHEEKYINDLEYEQALGDLNRVEFQKKAFDINAPHFVFYVRDQLEKMFGTDVMERGGLKVTTTLNGELQAAAEQIIAEEIEKVVELNITNGAAIVVDPRTGEILTMVGSADYFDDTKGGQFNVVVDGLRQPGSSIKPVTYLALIRKGYSPASMLADVPTTFAANDTVDPYTPKNYDGKFRGPVNLRDSLGSSLNIPAVKALAIVGVKPFLEQAYDMGFVTLQPTDENMKRFGLAVTLGGAEVHLIDTATAYSAFANGGVRVEPISILKVEDQAGHVLYEHRPVKGRQVITPEESFLINHILSDNNARLMAFGARSLLNTGKAIAVKTGTTNDAKDNLAIGWSQEVLVGAWVGNNDSTSMSRVASGVSGASPIWRRIIDTALTLGYGAPAWEVPAGVEEVEVDAISGYPAHDGFLTRRDYFIKGTLPGGLDPFHTRLKLCRGEQKLANDARIAAGDYDEKEFVVLKESDPVSQDGKNRWQEGINGWIASQADERYKVPTEYCGEQSEVFVRLERPEDQKSYSEQEIPVKVTADSGDGIEQIEIVVNGQVRETVKNREYEGKLSLPTGRYEIYAKVKSRSGKEATSNTVKIGTGGADWKESAPTPTPTSAPTPSPSTLPLPTVSPGTGGGNGNGQGQGN